MRHLTIIIPNKNVSSVKFHRFGLGVESCNDPALSASDESENVRIHMSKRICGRDVARCLQVALPTQRRVRLGKTNGTVSMAIKSTNDKAGQGPALCWGE